MSSVAIRAESLAELLGQRDRLVQAIQGGMTSGSWDAVMPAFDGLLAAIARLEEEAGRTEGTR
jgi:hypothetical protein